MEISSKEDFKVAFDKIPDYKIRKEKVSFVVIELDTSLERDNCEWIQFFLSDYVNSFNLLPDGGDGKAAGDAGWHNAHT